MKGVMSLSVCPLDMGRANSVVCMEHELGGDRAVIITPHTQRERGKVIDRGVNIYYMSVVEKNLNRTLEIDSPFQTLTVGLLVEFID